MNSPHNEPAAGDLGVSSGRVPHLKDYVRVIMARRWIVVSMVVVVVGATSAWVFTRTPIYVARAQLLIEPARGDMTKFSGGTLYDPTLAGGVLGQNTFYATQYKLILSRPNLEKTFQRFEFGKMKAFRSKADPIPSFRDIFVVAPVRRSRLAWVSFEWPEPELAARTVDYLVREYIASYRERALGVTRGGLEALKRKRDEMRPQVEAGLADLQQFRVKHNVVAPDRTQSLIVERQRKLNEKLMEADREALHRKAALDNIKKAIEEKRPLEDMPEVLKSESIGRLKFALISAKQALSSLTKSGLGGNHPKVQAARASLETVETKMREEIRSAYTSTAREYERAREQMDELRRQLADQRKRVQEFNRLAGEYKMLLQGYETRAKAYDAVLKRIQEVDIAMTAQENDSIFVIDKARVPVRPAKPRKKMILAVSGVLALALGVGLCFFIDYLDTTIKTKEEVERVFGVPAVGFVPHLRDPDAGRTEDGEEAPLELAGLRNPRSALAESFRSIRTSLDFSLDGDAPSCFLVTSCSPREGKTMTSVNLAIAFATAGKRVILVDADMRKPRIHKVFGVSSRPGLSNCLREPDRADVREVVRRAEGVDNLDLLTCGPTPPNPAELLTGPRVREALEWLNEEYEVVILDTPPIINVTDAAALSRLVQGVLMVVRSFSTQRDIARRGVDIVRQAGGSILGVIQNNVDTPRGGYYAYDSYYYYQQYYYYGEDERHGAGKGRRRRKTA